MNKEKSKPAAAATVTDLEENAVASISEDIIADTGENVKTLLPPEIVITALTDKLEDELRRLKESDEYITDLKNKLESEESIRSMIQANVESLRRYIRKIGYGDVLTLVYKDGDSE